MPSGWGGSALQQYNLHTGRTRTLYRGLAEAFVPYGDDILFTALVPNPPEVDTKGNGAPEQMYAVNQRTGKPTRPPSGITAAKDGADTFQTDGDLIIWNAALGALRAWRPVWGRSISLLPQEWKLAYKLNISAPANPRLYKHFIVWQPSVTYVLDLRTYSFARITPRVSESDVSGPYVSVIDTDTNLDVAKRRGEQRWTQHLLNLDRLPGLPGCRR